MFLKLLILNVLGRILVKEILTDFNCLKSYFITKFITNLILFHLLNDHDFLQSDTKNHPHSLYIIKLHVRVTYLLNLEENNDLYLLNT